MYNPAKMSNRRTTPSTHSILYLSYCHALHILTANLCLNILHIKKTKTFSIFLAFTYFDCVYFSIFFILFLKNKPEMLGLSLFGELL